MNNEPRMNNLIPMQDPQGGRCFVTQWDVEKRKAEGWSVLGNLSDHTSTTKAPVDALNGGKANTPAAATATGDALNAERARVRAITKAADDEQAALADKLIADGTAEADALKALAVDRAERKKKGAPTKPVATGAAANAAPPTT